MDFYAAAQLATVHPKRRGRSDYWLAVDLGSHQLPSWRPLRSRRETTRRPGAQGPPLPRRPVSWSTTQRSVETPPGPTPREMDRPGPEGQRNPPGGPVEASDEPWPPMSNATALAGYAITTTTTNKFWNRFRRFLL